MDLQLYSETLTPFEGEINNLLLRRSIRQLADFYPVGQLLKWDDDRIALPVKIPVELPPLGNYDSLDIRAEEPILLVFHPAQYPTTAPAGYPDRMDFPKDQIAHLYIDRQGRPPQFCLIRGYESGLNEWYANKQIKDYAIRISNWFRDAAAGTLSDDAGQWEPLRLRRYTGSLTYDYEKLANTVNTNASYERGEHFAIWRCERSKEIGNGYNWTFIEQVTPESIEKHVADVQEEANKEDGAAAKKYLYLAYVLWSPNIEAYSNYDVLLPSTWGEFKNFCVRYGIHNAALERELTSAPKNRYITIPIVIAIRRPCPLIGYSGSIEFLNFQVRLEQDQVTDDTIADDATFKVKNHIQPLTRVKAQELSGFSGNELRLGALIGCGALGARIGLHFAKSGVPPWVVVDPGTFTGHNFLRHPLTAAYNGMYKAHGLSKEIEDIFKGASISVIPVTNTGQEFIRVFSQEGPFPWPWLFDFTASPAFQNDLVGFDFSDTTKIVKGYISDFGNLGVLMMAGANHNPRIDDLQVLLYTQALGNDEISSWLQREAGLLGNSSFVNIGVGCHTETTILSNDIVDLHAALMAINIKSETSHPHLPVGKIQLQLVESSPIPRVRSLQWEFNPLEVYQAVNNRVWHIRFVSSIIDKIREQMMDAFPKETGGIFVGCANYKTNTIHVVDLIDAPPDSHANEVCFTRGIEGLPEKVRGIHQRSGGQLGYIGEWHSHPDGPEGMSTRDMATAELLHESYRTLTTPLPVLITIVTCDKILPYVFD